MRPLSLDEICQNADVVVIGKVEEMKSEWALRDFAKSPIIYTFLKIRVEDYIAGEGESEVVVCIPGGSIGDIGLGVSDVPSFKKGERVILFLGPMQEDGTREIPSLFQGKYTIVDGVVKEIGTPLSSFLEEIRKHLRRR